MQRSIAKESRHRRLARRLGVAVLALVALLTLGACRATGGGYLPPQGGVGAFQTQANFGFNFTCEIDTVKQRAVIRGTITYHDDPSPNPGAIQGIKLNGTVDPILLEETKCEDLTTLPEFDRNKLAAFRGVYRSQDTTIPATKRQGRFEIVVWDEGEPSRQFSDGDYFDIHLLTGPYAPYNRAGYIEGGNIQVENDD
jgi:hypothetical protein